MKTLWEKIKQINWADRRLITVIVIVVLVFLMMDFNNRMTNMLQLNKQEEILLTQMADLESTLVDIESQIAYATSDRALEEWAREKNRLIEQGDYPIIVKAPLNQVITPTPKPKPQEVVTSRMEIWQQLLFGGED